MIAAVQEQGDQEAQALALAKAQNALLEHEERAQALASDVQARVVDGSLHWDKALEEYRSGLRDTPGLSAAMNLWYLRAAFDHLLMHDLQELLSPGYLQRMRDRAEREFGQSYFWEPGGSPIVEASGQDLAPERAPDIAKAVGGQ